MCTYADLSCTQSHTAREEKEMLADVSIGLKSIMKMLTVILPHSEQMMVQ